MKCPRKGWPRSLTNRDKRMIMRDIITDKASTAVNILGQHPELTVCADTVWRGLLWQGLTSASKIKKPLLSLKNKRNRLDFANQHIDWTINDWRQVIFSDETKINRHWSDGRQWCWKRGKCLDDRTIRGTVKFGGGSLMIWGV